MGTDRTDGDSWDIVSSVGRTARGVATFRAWETARPDALVEDLPFFFPGFMGGPSARRRRPA